MERFEDREEAVEEEVVDERWPVMRVVDVVRERVMQLGVPGLLLYNLVKGTVAFAVVASATGESVEDKLLAGAAASAVLVLSGQTFWAAMGILGVRAGQRFLKK